MTDEILAQSENEQTDNIEFEQNSIEQGLNVIRIKQTKKSVKLSFLYNLN